MSLWDAILQGIIQGLTEFLPVSSSGHLSLYQHFTGQSGDAGGGLHCFLGYHLGDDCGVFPHDRGYLQGEIHLSDHRSKPPDDFYDRGGAAAAAGIFLFAGLVHFPCHR